MNTEEKEKVKKIRKTTKTKNSQFVAPVVTFIPTVTYPMVEQWFKAFYYGEYGEMILNRIISLYKYIYQITPTSDIVYLTKSDITDKDLKTLPQELIDLYYMMSDFGAQHVEFCMINPFELENEFKDEYYKRF